MRFKGFSRSGRILCVVERVFFKLTNSYEYLFEDILLRERGLRLAATGLLIISSSIV